jgi:hypothetical protein
MLSVQVETKISGRDDRRSQALSLAEAGVAEAISRIRNGDVPDLLNPRMASQIFLVGAGSVPVLGTDSIALPTVQPAGRWLTYSTPGKGDQALTVTYRTDAARTRIYRYDQTRNPPIQTATGQPIFVITSTGRKGTDTRTVVTEVIQKPYHPEIKAAIVADYDIRFIGNSIVCGYNHRLDTPLWYGENGRVGAKSCVPYETNSGGVLGAWSSGGITSGGASEQAGQPTPSLANQTGFYTGPWDAIGVPQADFYSMAGSPLNAVPANLNAITYLDNDGVGQNQSGSFAIHGGNGEGLLYVDGDLTLNGNFTYKGLIYIEGDLKLNGQAWILGGIVVRGKSSVKVTGGATVLYSSEAIERALSKYAGQFVTVSWREK